MMNEILGKCPVCGGKLRVTRMACYNCETKIEGEFGLDKFSYLSKEEKAFVEIFVKNRGNIKEIEKDLGVSYPTVRRLLDQAIESLGYNVIPDAKKISDVEVLDKLEKGEITAEEAFKLLER
ncbi:MAG: DUF2089 domain-containing protein [Clostridiales bacterium]|nr:DUF2089 domain-containing protein [Clostridiales bacterium]